MLFFLLWWKYMAFLFISPSLLFSMNKLYSSSRFRSNLEAVCRFQNQSSSGSRKSLMMAKKLEINVLGFCTEGYKPTPCNCFMDYAVKKVNFKKWCLAVMCLKYKGVVTDVPSSNRPLPPYLTPALMLQDFYEIIPTFEKLYRLSSSFIGKIVTQKAEKFFDVYHYKVLMDIWKYSKLNFHSLQ